MGGKREDRKTGENLQEKGQRDKRKGRNNYNEYKREDEFKETRKKKGEKTLHEQRQQK